jgi:hypothetical protein
VFYEFELGNRKLYLFGEIHARVDRDLDKLKSAGVNRYNSLSFQAFVHSLAIQNRTKTYDFMFENAYFNKILKNVERRKHTNSNVFNQIYQAFENCIVPAKRRHCFYKNLRIHYVDFRKHIDFIKIRNSRKNLPPHEIRSEITKMLKTPGKVLKQINAIKDDRIRNSFIDFFRDFVANKAALTGPALAGFRASAIMDVYAMSRILRDFDSKKKNGVSSFEGTAQNVIYYAGVFHTLTFVRFLTDYLKLKPKAVRGEFNKFPKISCRSFVDMGDVTKTMV